MQNGRQIQNTSLGLAIMSPLFAGMASPLPLETEFVQRLNNSVEYRLQAISFFLLALLICTLVVCSLWNYLRRDLTFLPRLSFGKALAGVILWGLLVFVVLTMISGARELMTPGAGRRAASPTSWPTIRSRLAASNWNGCGPRSGNTLRCIRADFRQRATRAISPMSIGTYRTARGCGSNMFRGDMRTKHPNCSSSSPNSIRPIVGCY